MLKGLRGPYLGIKKTSGPPITEGNITAAVLQRYSDMETVSTPWRNLWKNILRLFFPALNNVYYEGTGGEIRVNQVWAAEMAMNVDKLANFLHTAMYPETHPWLGVRITEPGGKKIDKGKLSTAMIQHTDEAVQVTRAMLEEGGFGAASLQNIYHFLLLGNAPMRVIPAGNGRLVYKDAPIHRMNVQRDNLGQVYAVSWQEAIDKWQIVRDYGMETYNLFLEASAMPQADPQFMTEYSKIFSGGGGVGGGFSAGGMTGQSLGAVSQSVNKSAEQVVKLLVPNNMATGIPGGGDMYPEMEYVGYIVSQRTRRLIDVEYYPVIPIGVASDVLVVGEEYARGLCGMVLPNAAVLNRKKRASYYAESKILNSPLVVSGPGFVNKAQEDFKENEMLFLNAGSKVEPMFDAAAVFRQKQAFYEGDRQALERDMGIDKTEVALADRMTASEYTQRRDTASTGYQPRAAKIYDGSKTILNATLQYAYMSGRLPPPPEDLLLSGLNFEFEVYSTFTYGMHSEKGMNVQRALAPIAELLPVQPEILDHIDFESILRRNFASYELGNSLNTQEKVDMIRNNRSERAAAQRAQGGGGQGQLDPTQKGEYNAEAKRHERIEESGPESQVQYQVSA